MTRRGAAFAVSGVAALAGCLGGGEPPLGPSANQSPQIRSVTVTPTVVNVGGTAVVQVEAVDPDGDRIFYRYEVQSGVIQPDPAVPGRATYLHNGVARAADSLVVTVTDSKNASASVTQPIALQGNRAPVVSVTGGESCHPACAVSFTAEAADPDGDACTYLWSGCATGAGRTATCRLTGVGPVTATVVVSDGRGGVTAASATAEGTNRAPVVTGGLDVRATQARFNVDPDDPDGDTLTCGWWGNCNCTGSQQSYNLDCLLPPGLATCFQRFACNDPFGAIGETTFRLLR